jgi:hypothetical protein
MTKLGAVVCVLCVLGLMGLYILAMCRAASRKMEDDD